MNTTEKFDTASTVPAALPKALQNRLLNAMLQAADEEREYREVEQVLRRFSPAPLPSLLTGQLGVKMYVAQQQARRGGMRSHYGWKGVFAAAAALVFCATAVTMLLPRNAAADGDKQGLMSRNVIDSRSSGKVEWRQGEAPVRHYQVIYEDSFVLDAEDTTTVIRVPNSTQVEVEEEYL